MGDKKTASSAKPSFIGLLNQETLSERSSCNQHAAMTRFAFLRNALCLILLLVKQLEGCWLTTRVKKEPRGSSHHNCYCYHCYFYHCNCTIAHCNCTIATAYMLLLLMLLLLLVNKQGGLKRSQLAPGGRSTSPSYVVLLREALSL